MDGSKIKIVFFDIDGTLVNNHQTILESTKKALIKLKENNIKIFIATGRTNSQIDGIKELLPIEIDGWIVNNGQLCIIDNQVIYEQYIPNNEVIKGLEFLKTNKIGTFLADINNTYVLDLDIDDDYFLECWEYNKDPLYNMNHIKTYPIFQLMVHIHENNKELEKEFFSILKSCKPARWNEEATDVIIKDSGKDIGIDKVLDYYHYSIENSMAFGDGYNDIDMIKHVDIGIAMGNSVDILKENADYITTNIEDDGIYEALEKFQLI